MDEGRVGGVGPEVARVEADVVGRLVFGLDPVGMGVGERLVVHSLETAKQLGFRIMQFNAVVRTNLGALRLYERLGFQRLGVIPGGFRMDDRYEDIVPMYRIL